MDGENQSGMQCVECEGLLAEAIDGTLHGSTLAAFEAHQKSCPACRAMVEEATAGMHWLKGLDEVEPPRNLVHNILTQTIGALPSEHAMAAPRGDGWLDKLRAGWRRSSLRLQRRASPCRLVWHFSQSPCCSASRACT